MHGHTECSSSNEFLRLPGLWRAIFAVKGVVVAAAGILACLACAPDLGAEGAPAPAPKPREVTGATREPGRPAIFIAGDSTAARHDDGKIQGWGVPFTDLIDPAVAQVVNRARGGRSSRTFVTEGLWDELVRDLEPGDVVLIQFGHNDGGAINEEPPGSTRPLRARGTLPGIGEESTEIDNVLTLKHEVVHTFGWYLRRMIADVRARGATPIVLSPTVRNIWADGRVEDGPGAFGGWSREVADAAGVSFLDLSRMIADEYQRQGPDAVRRFFGPDHTHTSAEGAALNARLVLAGLRALPGDPVRGWTRK